MAAATSTEARLFLKLVVSKESNKVVYGEVDSDFADVLLSFLTLPLGTIVRLLIKHYGNNAPILGSLNSLYLGLVNLDTSYFWTDRGKMMLLNPRNSSGIHCSGLKLQIDDTPPIQYFTCQKQKCVSLYYQANCFCSASTNTDITKELLGNRGHQRPPLNTKQTSSFVLSDDLQILLNSPISIFRMLKLSGIQDTRALEERSMMVGLKEIMELLKRSLISKTPLTDAFLSSSYSAMEAFPPAKYESDGLPGTQTGQNTSSSSGRKFKVKALVQESTKRVLLAQTGDGFIDLLFSFLTYPLGSVQLLLGNDTFHGSINNLYRSMCTLEMGECMMSQYAITRFLDPKLPPYYLSSSQIFYIIQEESYPKFRRWSTSGNDPKIIMSSESRDCYEEIKTVNPRGGESFVKGPALFIVTDDLAVSSAASLSIISTLNRMKIPISDIVEVELEIDLEKALSILHASLTSIYALTDGLKPFLKRSQVPKQEQ